MKTLRTFILALALAVGIAGQAWHAPVVHAQQLVVTTLLNNQTVDETTGAATPRNSSSHFNVSVEWGAGTSAGVVQIETAPSAGYTGTWSNLTSFTWATETTIDTWRGTGPFGAIRARISTVITTSNKGVTVTLFEN